jgi:magnesium-transporting ATPase (P-type)
MANRQPSGSDFNFGCDTKKLQDLVGNRGVEAIQVLNDQFGGLNGLAYGLKTNLTDGLPGEEADLQRRRDVFGSNMIPAKKAKSFLQLAWEALQDFTLIVLIIAATISLILGLVVEKDKETSWIDGFAILMAVVVVVLVTASNDYSKELQFQSLQKQIKQDHKFAVIRNGEVGNMILASLRMKYYVEWLVQRAQRECFCSN